MLIGLLSTLAFRLSSRSFFLAISVIDQTPFFNSPLKNLNLCYNDLGSESKTIAQVVLQHAAMEVFCEIPMKDLRADSLTELDLKGKGIQAHGAIVLADLIKVSSALVSLNLEANSIGNEGAASLAAVLSSR